MLKVILISKFDIRYDGKPVILASRAAQSLLAYLILTAGTLHRREKLAGMLWPEESEQKARTYLRNEIWRIRKALSQTSKVEYLLADNVTIGFNPSAAYQLDAAKLKNLSDASSTDELIQALSNYQGELLPGFYDDWVGLEREHLQTLFEQKIECLLELLEKEERWGDILEWAERWISLGQAPEAAYRALMFAYDALGDHSKVASTYERCKQALRQFDLEPSEQTRALAFKRNPKINIPIPLTSFIGRKKELKEVAGLFSKSRLITLTGTGGVGKTRLAIQVVPEVLDLFPDGVWFLDLAPLSNPSLVPNTLANLLGLRESGEISAIDLLLNYFHSRTALIIFDNCEHLIDASAQLIHSLLTSCEHIAILVTSRETLRVAGEFPYRVPSLELLKPDSEFTIDEILSSESIKLFIERATAMSPKSATNQKNTHVLAQICQRLDGIPLAIELAAARVNVLTVEQILDRLDDRFNLLRGDWRSSLPRHRTLRATIEWSYELLEEKERVLFRRLAVFNDGWSLQAAEEICAVRNIASEETLELLSQLANKSLITVQTSRDEKRYRMLETLRQYANERLFEAGEKDLLRNVHLDYFLSLAETAESHLRKAEQIDWLRRLDIEHENLRSAQSWAMDQDSAELALRLTGALAVFWEMRAYWLEGARSLDQVLNKEWDINSKVQKAARAKVFYRRADIAYELDQLEMIKNSAESALALCKAVDDLWGIAYTRARLASNQIRLHLLDTTVRASLEKSLHDFQKLGDPWGESWVLNWLASALIITGKREEYLGIRQRAIARALDSGDRERIAESLVESAIDLSDDSKWDEAEKMFQEAEQFYTEIDSSLGINRVRFFRTQIFFARGFYERAKANANLIIEYCVRSNEKDWHAVTFYLLALIAEAENNFQRAVECAHRGLELRQEVGVPGYVASGLSLVARLEYRLGNVEVALQYVREGMEFVRKGNVAPWLLLAVFDDVGGLFVEKNPQGVVQILALTECLSQSLPGPRDPIFDKPYFDRFLSEAKAKISEDRFTHAWKAGLKMTIEEAVDLVLKMADKK